MIIVLEVIKKNVLDIRSNNKEFLSSFFSYV